MNSKLRTVFIWLVSFAAVLAVFMLYVRKGQTPSIRSVSDPNLAHAIPDVNDRIGGTSGGQIGGVSINIANVARYANRDENGQITYVWGFNSVPSMDGDQWELEKPYVEFPRPRFNCLITAETGIIRIEKGSGSVDPKEGMLKGNVTIRISPSAKDETDSFIYLDDLAFFADESRFSTQGSVEVVSDRVSIVGRGLEGIYSGQLNRLEFLRIVSLTEPLRIKGEAASLFASDQKQQPQSAASKPAARSEAVDDPNDLQHYHCAFSRNVVIDSPDQLVVADRHITVNDILWAKSKDKTDEVPIPTDSNAVVTEPNSAPVPPTEDDSNQPADIVITCDNGILIAPMDSNTSIEDFASINTANDLKPKITTGTLRRPMLHAKTIDYSYDTGDAIAAGPVTVVFYPNDVIVGDANQPSAETVPITVTANEYARFLPESNLIQFKGDCVSTMMRAGPVITEDFRLTAPLLEMRLLPDSNDAIEIEQFTARGKDVNMRSTKSVRGKAIGGAELICRRFDYFAQQQTFMASGPGMIKLINLTPPDPNDEQTGFSLDKPYWAVIENFDNLHYSMTDNILTADRDPNESLVISYFPIADGNVMYDQLSKATADHVEAKMIPADVNHLELKSLTATGTVTYADLAKKLQFEGGLLFYDSFDARVTVHGDGFRPCTFNGIAVDNIEWDLETDEKRFNVVAPGAIQLK